MCHRQYTHGNLESKLVPRNIKSQIRGFRWLVNPLVRAFAVSDGRSHICSFTSTRIILYERYISDFFAALSLALGSTESKRQASLYVLATAVDTPAGIIIGLLFVGLGSYMVPLGLGFSAGTFIYVSATDLIPELQHQARSLLVVMSMVAGFVLVVARSIFLPAI